MTFREYCIEFVVFFAWGYFSAWAMDWLEDAKATAHWVAYSTILHEGEDWLR